MLYWATRGGTLVASAARLSATPQQIRSGIVCRSNFTVLALGLMLTILVEKTSTRTT
jgi:hypothetical protein